VFGGLALALLVFVYYVGLVTQFSYELWPTTSGGFVFNSQSRALLDGRLDIDPKVIGNEGFERDGRTYTYFGLWPALLRLPLANQLWRDWTSLSCALAATLAALALISAAAATAAPAERPLTRAIALTLAASFVLSGPQVELLGKPSVYVEAVLWAYAAACVFLCAALPLLYGRTATTARLTVLAACAAVALLARVSTGLALYVAFAAFVCVLAWRAIQTAGAWRTLLRRLLPGLALLAAAVLVTAVVNTQRWGRPFEFAPLTLNKYYAADPVRLERLARHGAFSLARLPDALSYYAAPGWFFAAPAGSARAVRVDDLFDGPEGPPRRARRLGLYQRPGRDRVAPGRRRARAGARDRPPAHRELSLSRLPLPHGVRAADPAVRAAGTAPAACATGAARRGAAGPAAGADARRLRGPGRPGACRAARLYLHPDGKLPGGAIGGLALPGVAAGEALDQGLIGHALSGASR